MRASTPGKLILLGEHAVVYGQAALIAAVDRRLTVHFTTPDSPSPGIELDLPELGVQTRCSWAQVLDYAHQARELWERYAEAPSARRFREVRGDDPAHLVKVALGEAAGFRARASARKAPQRTDAPDEAPDETPYVGLRLAVESDLPIGSGFGSSAALAVATLAGTLAALGVEATPDEIEALALEVERRQHGLPSGVDGATVLHGGAVWAERDARGKLATTPLPPGATDALARFRVFDTGTPRQTTGEVVAAVRERLDRDPGLRTAIEEIGELTRRFRSLLEREPGAPTRSPAEPLAELMELVREVELRLEALGVVPEPVQELIRRIEREGGAAKISGAGALSSPTSVEGGLGAGSLLVLHPEPERIPEWRFLDDHGLEPLDLRLGAAGLQIQPQGRRQSARHRAARRR